MLIAAFAILCGAFMDAIMKLVMQRGDPLQVVGWRYILGSIIIAALLCVVRPALPSVAGWRFHVMRGAVGCGAGVCFFYALTQLALSEATVVGFSSALMIAPIAWLLLKERVSTIVLCATLVGFLGVGIAVLTGEAEGAPTEGNRLLGFFLTLMAAVFYAFSIVMLRVRSHQESTLVIVAFSNIVPALMLLPLSLQMPVERLATDGWLIGLAACFGVAIWWLMTLAYKREKAQKLAPLEYTALIWATLLGWVVFAEKPHLMLFLGAIIVVAACLAVAFEGLILTRTQARASVSDNQE